MEINVKIKEKGKIDISYFAKSRNIYTRHVF